MARRLRSPIRSNYPELNQYGTLADKLVTATKGVQTEDDRVELIAQTKELVQKGAAIMRLYGAKNPACNAQFEAFLAALPQMDSLPLEQVKSKYHDGTALPSAPRHCYFGRSEIVHPVMNIIRLKGVWSERVRGDVVEDFEEVIEHLPRIEKNLDNPPLMSMPFLSLNSSIRDDHAGQWECMAKSSYGVHATTVVRSDYTTSRSAAERSALSKCRRQAASPMNCRIWDCWIHGGYGAQSWENQESSSLAAPPGATTQASRSERSVAVGGYECSAAIQTGRPGINVSVPGGTIFRSLASAREDALTRCYHTSLGEEGWAPLCKAFCNRVEK